MSVRFFPLYFLHCYLYPVIILFLEILSFHFFISSVLALMSVAIARSIQDGVLVLSNERKMNVAAMHHSLLTV